MSRNSGNAARIDCVTFINLSVSHRWKEVADWFRNEDPCHSYVLASEFAPIATGGSAFSARPDLAIMSKEDRDARILSRVSRKFDFCTKKMRMNLALLSIAKKEAQNERDAARENKRKALARGETASTPIREKKMMKSLQLLTAQLPIETKPVARTHFCYSPHSDRLLIYLRVNLDWNDAMQQNINGISTLITSEHTTNEIDSHCKAVGTGVSLKYDRHVVFGRGFKKDLSIMGYRHEKALEILEKVRLFMCQPRLFTKLDTRRACAKVEAQRRNEQQLG